jgi:uncharacterized protein YecT (DUF1311 family)
LPLAALTHIKVRKACCESPLGIGENGHFWCRILQIVHPPGVALSVTHPPFGGLPNPPLMTSTIHAMLIALAMGISGCSIAIADTASGSEAPNVTDLARPAYKACLKNAKGRVEQGPCITQEQTYQDEQLATTYQHLSKAMTAEQRSALEQSQSAWKAFRQVDARLGVALLDPAGLDLSVSDNTILLTIQRRQMLEHLIRLTQ